MNNIIAKDKENNRKWINNIFRDRAKYYNQNFSHLFESGNNFEIEEDYYGNAIMKADKYTLSHCSCSGLKGALKIKMDADTNLLYINCEFQRQILDDIEYEIISKMNTILLSMNTVVFVQENGNIAIKSWLDTSLKYYYVTLNDPCDDEAKEFYLSCAINDFILSKIDTFKLFADIMNFINDCESIDEDFFEEIREHFWG